MRARNIKPGYFVNDDLGALPPITRIAFAGLWCIADRAGRMEDKPKRIKVQILPYDDVDMDDILNQLHDAKFITRYIADGQEYIEIPNFSLHQNPHKHERESEIPPYSEQVHTLHSTSTVQVQYKDGDCTGQARLIPDSLIPDSLIPDSIHPGTVQEPDKGGRVPRKTKKDAAEETPEFQTFYLMYPRHVKRAIAFKAWQAAIKKTTVDRIMEALHNQLRAGVFKKDDPQYIMHPSSWLNGQCWDDDVPFTPAPPDTRPTKFRVQPIIDPETGEELEAVRTLEYPTFEAMEAAMKSMQVDRKDDTAGYWLFTEAGYAQQVEAARRKRGMFAGLVRRI
jgi:hypothetical protein